MQAAIKAILSLLLCFGVTINTFAQTQFESDDLHGIFTQILRESVSNDKVNYPAIKEDPRFDTYLQILKQAKPDLLETKAEKLAFWINAYNALAIEGILDGLSPSSFWGRISYFKTRHYEIAGRSINLYDLERDIIIPLNEPRIHFAIVCASLSCPKLRSKAYLAATLEQQLNDSAINFINDPNKNEFDTRKKQIRLSKIFDWFENDFKQHSGSVQKYLAAFIKDPVHKQTLLQEGYRVKYLKYNWSLNGTPAN